MLVKVIVNAVAMRGRSKESHAEKHEYKSFKKLRKILLFHGKYLC